MRAFLNGVRRVLAAIVGGVAVILEVIAIGLACLAYLLEP